MLAFVDSLERMDRRIQKWIPDSKRSSSKGEAAPAAWPDRLRALFPAHFTRPFSPAHVELWEWADAIAKDSSPRPFVAIWARGRGKSTNAEAIAADLGARGCRAYCMYVSGTQDQADKHVMTIRNMLEADSLARYFPAVGRPRVGKNGSQTWRREMLITANGYAVEAVGLDKAVRGQKIDWARPDLIIFDDVDEKHDTAAATNKKQETITTSILPAGADNCAVLFVQNVIHLDSIAHRLSRRPGQEGAADYLAGRVVSGPFPAVEGLKYEYAPEDEHDAHPWKVTAGRSLWEGFGLEVCQAEINREGPTAFELESQHRVDVDSPNALLSAADFDRTRVAATPDLTRVGVAVDPPGGATECGIVAGGKARIGKEWHGYTLEDATAPAGVKPEVWALAVLQCYYRHKADVIFVERNYGGDMAAATIRQAKWLDADGRIIVDGAKVHIVEVVASRGKAVRAEPVAVVFQQGRGHHVGALPGLELEWRRYQPGDKDSPNRLDAEVWLYTGLELIGEDTAMRQGRVRGRPAGPDVRRAVRRIG
jgi:hypothetical protein